MKLAVLLRKDADNSLFRKGLLTIASIPGEELILCSGTITRIYEDPSFFSYIMKGFQGVASPEITLLGMRGRTDCKHPNYICGKCNACKYNDFVNNVRTHGISNGYNVQAYREKNDRWHAKIAIKVVGGEPLAAVIGSSNLTVPAYGEECKCKGTTPSSCPSHGWINKGFIMRDFSIESDILFWDDIKLPWLLKQNNSRQDELEDDEVIIAQPLNKDIKKYLNDTLNQIRSLISNHSNVHKM